LPVLGSLGDASYSIYLLHYVPIMLAWDYIPKDSYWALTASAGIAFGFAAYWLVERPMMQAVRRRKTPVSRGELALP
jgi:peptidoglycan/LPS O-acetylase OafA/YrhL